MSDDDRTVRLTITGRVQGVGYRFWAERAAAALGVRGWVRNRTDGSVELLASGSESAIDALIEACRQGPRAAAVDGVAVEDAEDDGSEEFTARPTV
ncbi:MAG TPA: acylphosphatase [Stellaceae bacterium]|nr:acylphosphatase [Stellaceae bacterium]